MGTTILYILTAIKEVDIYENRLETKAIKQKTMVGKSEQETDN